MRLRLALPYALRGIRRHPGVAALLAVAVALAVALGALLLGEVGGAAAAFLARVRAVPLPAAEIAFYARGGAGYPAETLATGLGERLVVAGFPGVPIPGPGEVVAPAWLAQAAGVKPGATVAVGSATVRLAATYRTPWDRALPLLVVGSHTLPLAGKLYAGKDPPAGAAWTLAPDTGRQLARARLAGVFSPVLWLLALVAALGGLGAANAVLLSLLRRRRQFGIARALGWEDGDLAAWLSLEVAAVGVAGTLLGAAVAAAAAAWMAARQPLPLRLDGWDVLAAALLVGVVLAPAVRWPLGWMRGRSVADLLREG